MITGIFQTRGGEAGVPTYATVVDMEAAITLGDLVEGDVAAVEADGQNYMVLGGAAYAIPGSINLDGSALVSPGTEAADANAVLWVASWPWYPGLHDYAGTLSDDDFTNGLTLDAAPEDRPLYPVDSRSRPSYDEWVSDAALRITGALTLRVAIESATRSMAGKEFLAHGVAGGVTTADNWLYLLRVASGDESRINFLCEDASQNQADWEHPEGGFEPGQKYIVELVRSAAGVASLFVNGQQLAWVRATTNTTDNGDGTVSGFGASDGVDGGLDLGDDGASDLGPPYFWSIYNVEKADSETWGQAYSPQEYFAPYIPDESLHATLAAETDTAYFICADGGSVQDLTGNLSLPGYWNASYTPAAQDLVSGGYWLVGDAVGDAAAPDTSVVITSDLVMRAKMRVGETSPTNGDVIIGVGANGETLASNTLYRLDWQGNGTQIRYLHEYGAGSNVIVTFDLPGTLRYGQILYAVLRRTDNGDGTDDIELWIQQGRDGSTIPGDVAFQQCTIASVSGATDNGDGTATSAANAAGGTECVVEIFNGESVGFGLSWANAMLEFMHVKATTTDDSTESTVAAQVT